MANDRIKQLLSTSSNGDPELTTIKTIMKQYIASPWDAVNETILDEKQYQTSLNEYKTKYENGTDDTDLKLCSSNTDDEKIKHYKQILCQSHSGNLFEHSQWAALQILKWHIDKDPIMDGLELETTLIAAFFHDIGKGGDCVYSCNTNGFCWFDMYSNDKYNKKGDAVHPTYCSDMILGKIPFIVNCTTKETINIKELLLKIYPDLNIEKIALAALMHWEFGKLNIKNDYEEETKINNYLDMFFNSCQTLELDPNDELLKLCIAVACADITAGTNKRLLPSVDGIIPEKEVFLGKDPFVLFGMDKKYIDYRQRLIDAFNIREKKSMRGGGGNDSNDGVKKILMFSDIEGCQASPGKQSAFLCSKPFYDEIARRLDADPNLEVAFLGDYFDQGMRVYESIKGMKMLLDKFTKERVHVILGNRDVNKLRFFYELNMIYSRLYLPPGSRWATWDEYYDGLKDKIGVDLVKHILITSMGAKQEEDKKMTGLYSFMPYNKIKDAKDELALKYLKVAMGIIPSDKTTEDALDVLGFFKECKLAHVFNGKVLLAHGGGFDSDAFFDDNYVKGFFTKLPPPYSKTLEEYRTRLSGYTKDDLQSRLTETVTVQKSVDVYNNLLQTVLSQLEKERIKNVIERGPPSWQFILLQALGLKPNAGKDPITDEEYEDARYKSLIQSCSQDGCKGPNIPLRSDKDGQKLAKILKDSGITHVSYGHKPICFPIPVIYRREEVPGVTFISNDTSNGNRKVEEIGENTAIGTMVIFDKDGVKSKIEPIELKLEGGKVVREGKVGVYSPMFEPLTFDNTPVYTQQKVNVLKYSGPDQKGKKVEKEVVFNYKGYRQLDYVGGKHRSRNRKRNTKRSSKHVSKRTKRNKRHAKRSRKMRKY